MRLLHIQMHQPIIGGFILSLFLTTGCTLSPKPAREDRVSVKEYPQIVALEGLDEVVFVHDVVQESEKPLRMSVAVRNNDDSERYIQYRFLFIDSDRMPENRDPDWHFMQMPARTVVYLQGNALDAEAVDWRLEIRPAR